ncbi:hypothetical protein [Methylovirgula sp. 4M-Z18]|uniref:hypothetical protein n=1 Tax=Methylovirgula sp. 4M-Z18 TaxID=2293567 RepID=UPI000E2ED6A5|nr:hypothetical protein [Methylovirgula sp. 4M-Z18]RFB79840.1 hypothetical protein DYH55_10335 [Methylovirgula sp. 4M-Z18]
MPHVLYMFFFQICQIFRRFGPGQQPVKIPHGADGDAIALERDGMSPDRIVMSGPESEPQRIMSETLNVF